MVANPTERVRSDGGDVFVDRERELTRLEGALHRALEGSGGAVFLTGDAGAGKTALASEFMGRVRQVEPAVTVTRGRCVELFGAGEAYLPFLDALGKLLLSDLRGRTLKVVRDWAPSWCALLPAAYPDQAQALKREMVGVTKERMIREVGDALEAAAELAPMVLLFEDLQWADPSSVDLLRYLAVRIVRQRVLIVGSYRPSETGATTPLGRCCAELRVQGRCSELSLAPFGAEAVAAYLEARFPAHELPPQLGPLIHARTEGHPLFVTGVVQLLVDRGDIARTGERWQLGRALAPGAIEMPGTVNDIVHRRVAALSEEDRSALACASVLGREFSSCVLARLLEKEELEVEERLDRLDRVHQLLGHCGEEEVADGRLAVRYRFRQAVYPEALYAGLLSGKRILLHRRAAEALVAHHGSQASRCAVAIAVHFEAARDFASAADHFLHAAANAARLYAYGEALDHCDRALALAEKLPRPEGALRATSLLVRRGGLRHAQGRFDEAAEEFARARQAASALGAGEPEWAALAGRLLSLFFARRVEEMAAGVADGLLLAARTGREEQRAEALAFLALLLLDQGELLEVPPLLNQALAAARRRGMASLLPLCLLQRGMLHYFQSEYARAEEHLAEGVGLAEDLGDGFMALGCRMFLGLSRAHQGRVSEALDGFTEAIALARRNCDRVWLPRLVSHVGWVHRELQDSDVAHGHDREALALAREEDVPWTPEVEALLNLAFDHAQAGRDEEARQVQAELDALSGEGVFFGWYNRMRTTAARAAHAFLRGDMPSASALARELVAAATQVQARMYVIGGRRLLAESAMAQGDLAEAGRELELAAEVLRTCPCPLEAWKTFAVLGRLRKLEGRGAEAREAFARASASVRVIAEQVRDGDLRSRFLASPQVQPILHEAGAVSSEGGR